MPRRELRRDLVQPAVDEGRRPVEGRAQAVEAGGARGERLAVARQLEARVDAVPHDVGEIVDVEAGQVLRAIDEPQRAEGPRQRLVGGIVRVACVAGALVAQHGEARALGQEGAAGDAQREARVATLQEAHDRVDGREVAVGLGEEEGD